MFLTTALFYYMFTKKNFEISMAFLKIFSSISKTFFMFHEMILILQHFFLWNSATFSKIVFAIPNIHT